jgi:2-deoxy-D-gluconate 3-dehydrogenase
MEITKMLPEFNVHGKTVLITGASRGIGRNIALVFAEAGADVAVTGLSETNTTNVAKEICELGRRGVGLVTDATNLSETKALVPKILESFGHLDILINCVGDSIPGLIASLPESNMTVMDETNWHKILDINLTQAFNTCHAFGPHLLERGNGCVINVSGVAGLRARANVSAYAAAKAGLIRFTESTALEWAPYGVRVNAIAPGSFPDPVQYSKSSLQKREKQARETIPLRRLGKLREVGLLTLYLASDASSYITGQTIAIDGGSTIA